MPSASVNVNTSGQNTLIAAQGPGTFIRVLGIVLIGAGTVTAELRASSGLSLSGPHSVSDTSGLARGPSLEPLFTLPENTALVLNLSAAVRVTGDVTFVVLRNN